MSKKQFFTLILAIFFSFLASAVGSFFTDVSVGTWYLELNKPFFNPPNWVFGPVWSILYLMIGISLYLIWDEGINKKNVKIALSVFLIQWFFNAVWSVIFFGYHQIGLALMEIVLLWIFILLTIVNFYKVRKIAAYLLIPYLLWVSFATVLNLSLYLLN